MKIGDRVEWKSQAAGCWKTKTGEIVDIVLSANRPNIDEFPDLNGCGWGRKHESYIVRVGKKHYWPRVKCLIKI